MKESFSDSVLPPAFQMQSRGFSACVKMYSMCAPVCLNSKSSVNYRLILQVSIFLTINI